MLLEGWPDVLDSFSLDHAPFRKNSVSHLRSTRSVSLTDAGRAIVPAAMEFINRRERLAPELLNLGDPGKPCAHAAVRTERRTGGSGAPLPRDGSSILAAAEVSGRFGPATRDGILGADAESSG